MKDSFLKENNRMNKPILADSVESLIGSIYVDGGYHVMGLPQIENI